jgi:hypothetical protein
MGDGPDTGRRTMAKHIEVIVGDDLDERVWQYWFNEEKMQLILDAYKHMTRPSKRHKMQEVEAYRGWRRDTFKSRDEVPVPDEVRAAVLEKFRAMITIE